MVTKVAHTVVAKSNVYENLFVQYELLMLPTVFNILLFYFTLFYFKPY